MYAGFITPKRASRRLGVHQRFDHAAYRMIRTYLPAGGFPEIRNILHFEGYNGPDGIKSKQGLKYKTVHDHAPSHLYDPATDRGEVPQHIANHYAGLVDALTSGDRVRQAFEAAWLAHYVCDGLTPAHHFPLEEKITEAVERAQDEMRTGDVSKLTAAVRKNWAIWGPKGHLSTHIVNFEIGIAIALIFSPIKAEFSEHELARARELGPVEYFKAEARKIAALNLYERFYQSGWTNDIASIVKNTLAPLTAQAIGNIWLLAMLEASQRQVAGRREIPGASTAGAAAAAAPAPVVEAGQA
ncbi:MAG TPA: hypothetical protein VI322_04230 [Candidatus Saccharimonadia bacterium]